VGLIETFLEQSTDVGDRVIDPFMWSTTTAVAAIQSDRDYVGFELDETNYRENSRTAYRRGETAARGVSKQRRRVTQRRCR
jgi:DNA modification methylase